MKIFFRFPELLLVIAIILVPLVIGNTAFDIQQAVFVPVTIPLILTWAVHIYCRKLRLLAAKLRWAQVLLTLLCLIAILILMYSMSMSYTPKFHDPTIFGKVNTEATLFKLVQIVLLLTQGVFWLAVLILSIRKARKKSDRQPQL